MAITQQQREEILKVVVGLFNGAPGGAILDDLSEAVESGTPIHEIARLLAETDQFKELISDKTDTASQVEFLLNHFGLVGGGGGEPGSAAALAEEYFTQRIEEGANLGHIVYEAIHYLQGDPLPVFADTVQLLNNKVLVASTHAESYENIASVEEGISLLIGVISDKIYTLEEVLTFLTEKLEGNTGDGDGNGDGDTPPPPPPPAPTFRVNEADGEVTFSGTAAGNITFTTDSENVATFTRGGITATTKPDLDDITKVTLSSSQTLTGSAADLAKIEAIEGTGNLIITGAPTVAAIEAINFSGVEGTVTYNLSDTLENLEGAGDGVVSGADSYSLTDDDADPLENLTVAQAEIVAGATNAGNYTYTLSDTLENLAGASADAIDGATSYTLTDEAGVLEDISVAAAEILVDASNAGDYTYSLSDTLENLEGADADVIDDAESYEISDIDTVFQNVAVAGLPTEAQQALIDEASNKDDFGYSLSDTLENLEGADADIIDGATSYTLTDEAGVLEDISVAAAEILVDASNAGDYTYSLSDTLENLEGADADVIDDAESYEISDIDTVFQNVAVAGLPTEAQQALIDDASNKDDFAYSLSDTLENLAGAEDGVVSGADSYEISDIDTVFQNVAVAGLPTEAQQALIDDASNKDDFAYSLSDTLENLAGAEDGVIDGADSYTLTNDDADPLEDISVAAAEILADADNADDYTYSIDDTAAAIDDANANILNGATAITATGTDDADNIDLSNNPDGPVTTGVTIDLGDGDDIFVGGNGGDVITGGAGSDTITLGEGDDIIVYSNVVTEGGDTIHSFTVGTDKLQFSDADLKDVDDFAAYTGAGTTVTLSDGTKVEFVSGTDVSLEASSAEAAFLFDTETGTLSYDADGTGDGEAIIVATLVGVDNLRADDFTFIV